MSEYVWVKVGRKEILVKKEDLDKEYDLPNPVPAIHGCKTYNAQERLGLSIQTGRDIRTSADLARYCRENGSRVVEPGDRTALHAEDNKTEDQQRKAHEARRTGKVPGAENSLKISVDKPITGG